MKLYTLESTCTAPANGDLITLLDKKGRLADFFIWGNGDSKFLNFTTPVGEAQERIKLQDICISDYLNTPLGIPIFSARVKNIFTTKIADEMEFHECSISCEGEKHIFYLAKILKYRSLINKKLSVFRTLTDGETTILSKAVYLDSDNCDFYIARDNEFHERFAVSQNFVDLCKLEEFFISFIAG